jgi:hypothetical protein
VLRAAAVACLLPAAGCLLPAAGAVGCVVLMRGAAVGADA